MAENFDWTSKVTEKELLDYYGLMFSMANADNFIEKDELRHIYESIDLASLSPEGVQKVHKYMEEPPDPQKLIDRFSNAIKELRFVIYMNAIEVAIANDVIDIQEETLLAKMKSKFGISDEQDKAMRKFANKMREIKKRGIDDNFASDAIKTATAALVSTGVPITAVYFTGSVIGLSAAGITSGLAALGFGLGMVPGIGVTILIAGIVFYGFSKILDISSKRKKEKFSKERERHAQLVIKNLQESISFLTQKIQELQEMANTAEANQKAIHTLTERLRVLQQIVANKKASAKMSEEVVTS